MRGTGGGSGSSGCDGYAGGPEDGAEDGHEQREWHNPSPPLMVPPLQNARTQSGAVGNGPGGQIGVRWSSTLRLPVVGVPWYSLLLKAEPPWSRGVAVAWRMKRARSAESRDRGGNV